MQKVLITGANGFVGSYLSYLFSPNYRVVATGKGESRLFFAHPDLQYQQLDFTSRAEVEAIIGKERPDVIIHSGAMSKPDDCEKDKPLAFLTNVESTRYLLEAAADIKAFFIFLSTDFIFDGEKGFYVEEDEPSPVNYYGQTKLEAEKLVKHYTGSWSIVRTVLVYGDPRSGRQNILTMVASALKKGEPVRIFDDQLRTPTYVEDLAKAIKTIADRKHTGIYHVSGKDVLTPYGMAVAVARHLALDEERIEKITAKDLQQPARRPQRTGFDISKARRELHYEPVSFEEGLRLSFPQR
jgi:dTDP-4-dehydrorhamnose reductase